MNDISDFKDGSFIEKNIHFPCYLAVYRASPGSRSRTHFLSIRASVVKRYILFSEIVSFILVFHLIMMLTMSYYYYYYHCHYYYYTLQFFIIKIQYHSDNFKAVLNMMMFLIKLNYLYSYICICMNWHYIASLNDRALKHSNVSTISYVLLCKIACFERKLNKNITKKQPFNDQLFGDQIINLNH